MIGQKHPTVAPKLVGKLEGMPSTPFLNAAVEARRHLTGTMGFERPSWHEVAAGARPPFRDPENFEPGTVRGGWQQNSSCVEKHFQVELLDRVPEQVQVLIGSQAGPKAGVALSVVPTNVETTIPPHLFRVVPCAISASLSPCPCATADVAVYSTPLAIIAQLVHGWGCSVVGAICREAGGRVRTNMLGDARKLEIVVDGLPLRGGAQLAVDTTLVCARREAKKKSSTARWGWRLKLPSAGRSPRVVLAVEVGGRWSEQTRAFLSQLAHTRARQETRLMRKRAEKAWRLRWGGMLACAAAKAVASSLLDLFGGDGKAPLTHEVEGDFRHVGLCRFDQCDDCLTSFSKKTDVSNMSVSKRACRVRNRGHSAHDTRAP